MELSLFKPLYDTLEIRKQYTLAMPIIVKHEVINNNTLRLYVSSEDIKYGAVKIYVSNVSEIAFKAIGTNVNGSYKYVDVPISQNGTYYCYASLYSPFFEDSPIGGVRIFEGSDDLNYYIAEVTEIVVPSVTNDPDPYPHPNMFIPEEEHPPYLITSDNIPIVTETGAYITI